jgi:hypothetical protein
MTTIYECADSRDAAAKAREINEHCVYARIAGNLLVVGDDNLVLKPTEEKRLTLEGMIADGSATVVKL